MNNDIEAWMQAEGRHPDDWRQAVLDELAVCCMDASFTEHPRDILKKIIHWHIAVATDPAVNGGYRLVRLPRHERAWIWLRERWWRFSAWRQGCAF